VSLNIGNFDDVVVIDNEATNGIVYTPTGVCGVLAWRVEVEFFR
jgi:hypothetical protein